MRSTRRILARWRWSAAVVAALGAGCARPGGAPAPAREGRAAFRHAVDSLVGLPAFRNAHLGVLVVDPKRGDTIYSHDAGKLFLPASNMKLVTSSVAIARLGLDYRWVTTVAARGPVRDGTVEGDLLVFGRGDPTVSDRMRGDAMRPLSDIADSLYARGIRRVAGGVVLGADVFPGPTIGFGWSWDDLDDPDGAAVDELLFNDGSGVIHVRGGDRPGVAPSVVTAPARTYPPVRVAARTLDAADTARLRAEPLRAVRDTARGVFVVRGAIAARDTASLAVTFPDPDGAYLASLREALQDRGIGVDGRPADAAGAVDSLVRIASPPLRDVLPAMLKPSQNQMAEMLLRTLALVETGVGRADSARRVETAQLEAWGAAPDGFVLRDGSGMARYDYLSPETVVHVLDAMRRSPAFDAFYAALPIAGVDGTLRARMRGTPAEGNVHAKTGSLANTRSLSGYATTRDGRRVIFSVLCNNWTAPPALVLAVEDSIAARVAALRVR